MYKRQLLACSFLLQSDQNLLAPHLSTVAHEFGMDDVQRDEKLGGELAMGLFLLGAPAALAIGACADRYPRKLLLVIILLVGGAASLGTALARSYSDLFWMRALTGVSLGSALPVTFSLVGDMFAPSQRTAASGRVGVAMSAGVGFGQAMSGFLGAFLRSWRAPFVVVGLLFFLLAVVVWGGLHAHHVAKVARHVARRDGTDQNAAHLEFKKGKLGLLDVSLNPLHSFAAEHLPASTNKIMAFAMPSTLARAALPRQVRMLCRRAVERPGCTGTPTASRAACSVHCVRRFEVNRRRHESVLVHVRWRRLPAARRLVEPRVHQVPARFEPPVARRGQAGRPLVFGFPGMRRRCSCLFCGCRSRVAAAARLFFCNRFGCRKNSSLSFQQ